MNAAARRAWSEYYRERIEAALERDDWAIVIALLEACLPATADEAPTIPQRSGIAR